MDEEIKPGFFDHFFAVAPWLYVVGVILVLVWMFRRMQYVRIYLRNLYCRIYNWFAVKITTPFPLKVVKGEYPANTRHVQEDHLLVVEVQPGLRMVNIASRGPICLYFPYTYFIIKYVPSICEDYKSRYVFASLGVCFSLQQIRDTKGLVGALPLSNYNGDAFGVCLGDSYPKQIFDNLRELGEVAITCFWRTSFQEDVPSGWVRHSKAGSGEGYIRDILLLAVSIGSAIGAKDEPFCNYQTEFRPEPELEPEQPKSKHRKGGNKPRRDKKRKGSRRKT